MTDDNLRAGDQDREDVANRLRMAFDEGRLTLIEYDERLKDLYAARTYGELAPIVADLPALARPMVQPTDSGLHLPRWVVIMWLPWVAVNILCTLIWLATGTGYFWPFWVAVPWGCALVIPTAIGILKGRSGDDDDDRGDRDPGDLEQAK